MTLTVAPRANTRLRDVPADRAGHVYVRDTPVSDSELERGLVYSIDVAQFVIRDPYGASPSTVLIAVDAPHPCGCGGWAHPDTGTIVASAEDLLDVVADCDACGDLVRLVCREEMLGCYLSGGTFVDDSPDARVPEEFAEILRWRVKQLQTEYVARCLSADLTSDTDDTAQVLADTGRTLRFEIGENLVVRAGLDPAGQWLALWIEGGRECAVGCADNDPSEHKQGAPLRWTSRGAVPAPHPWADWCDSCSMSSFTSPRVVAMDNLIPGGNPPGWGRSRHELVEAIRLRAEHYGCRERRAATRTHLRQRADATQTYSRFLGTLRGLPTSETYWATLRPSDFDRLTGSESGAESRLAVVERWLSARPVAVYSHDGPARISTGVWGDKVWDLRRAGRRRRRWTVKLGYSDAPLGARLRPPARVTLPPDVETILDQATNGLLSAPQWSVEMDI